MRVGPTLPRLLDAALVPQGFVRARDGRRWHRTAGAREQVLGLRRNRSGEGTWWRLRGPVIDLVVAEALALHRFVRPWVAVWRLDLPQGLAGPVPEGVTHAAAHTLGRDGLDGEPLAALYTLHGPDDWATHGPHFIATALAWFENIQTTTDVLTHVRDEYRASMTRNA
jgi:hypothetical protein